MCSTIFIYEFIRFVKFADIIKSNLKIYKKIIKLFNFKKVSDFRKEKLILNYSKSLFIVSVKIFSILICILIFIIFLNRLSPSFINFIISFFGIFETTIVVLIYHKLKKKIYEKL